MAIYVLPHIDAGGNVRVWRNWVNFDPREPYSGYTYADLMLGTIADALAEVTTSNTHVEMALSGEMGGSLFRYPESYRDGRAATACAAETQAVKNWRQPEPQRNHRTTQSAGRRRHFTCSIDSGNKYKA